MTPSAPAPLRLAIVADARVPRCLGAALHTALSVPGIDFLGIHYLTPRTTRGRAKHLFTALESVENLLARWRGEPAGDFDRVDLSVALAARTLRPLLVLWRHGRMVPDASALQHLVEQKTDILLCCTQWPLDLAPGIVRHGALGLELGYGTPLQAAWASAAEVAQACPFVVLRLVDYAVPGAAERHVASIALAPTSIERNRRHAIVKGGAVLRRHLQSLTDRPAGDQHVPRLLDLPLDYPVAPQPTLRLFSQVCAQMGRRLISNRLAAQTDDKQWHLAYAFSDLALPDIPFDRLCYLAPTPGSFWADPFPLLYEGRHYILFEELPAASQRGRILAVEIGEDRPPGPLLTVLERGYHLSYPQVFHWAGALYMVPETRQVHRVELLRCRSFPSQWELVRVLLDDIQAVDATLWQDGKGWWMFVNVALEGNGSADELHLYFADTLLGEWQPHPANPLCADVRCTRPGGPLFEADGATFRPSQDGARCYGDALWINRIERLDRIDFKEVPVRRIAPDWHPAIKRMHTLGRVGRLTVLDCVVAEQSELNIQRAYWDPVAAYGPTA